MYAPCPTQARFPGATGSVVLPARAVETVAPAAADFVDLFRGDAWGRSITVFSFEGDPFDLDVRWTAGGGIGGNFIATGVGGILRMNLAATTVALRAATWFAKTSKVSLTCDDTGVTGNNNLKRCYRFTNLGPGASQEILAPPFGTTIECFTANAVQRQNILVSLLDTFANVIASSFADEPIFVGPAQKIRFTNNNIGAADLGITIALGF